MATLEEEIPIEGEEAEDANLLPGDLPSIQLDADQTRELTSWLNTEIDREKSNRSIIEEEWKEIQDLYEATEIEEKKDFPFRNAANIMIPVIATSTEEAWAWLMGVIFAPKDLVNVEPKRADYDKYKNALRNWITWSNKEEIGFEETCSSLFMEFAKLGTMVAKTIYEEETRILRLYNPSTRKYEPVKEVMRHNPDVIRVPVEDFLFPIEARSMEDCRWKAHRFKLSWFEVLRRRDDGRFDKESIDAIRNHYTQKKDGVAEVQREAAGLKQMQEKEHEFYEVWFEYVINENAEDQETTDETPVKLIATFHKDSQTIVRLQHNWYPLQLDPFDLCPFIPREGMLWGIGVGKCAIPFQLEVSAMHCQRLDNQTILNCVAYKYKVDSMIPPNLTITPGAGIPCEDPANDIIPFQLGQKFDSTLQEEEHTLKFLRDRLGIGKETELGETSTNAIIRAQEARIKSNAILKNVRRFITSIQEKIQLLYQQHYPDGKIISILGEEGILVEEFYRQAPKNIYYGVGLSVTATNSAVSKDQDRQNKLALFNLLVQYYQQAVTYLQGAINAQAPPALQQAALEISTGLGSYVRELLDDFDIPGRDRLVIEPERLIEFANQLTAAQSSAGDAADPRMGALPEVPTPAT